MNFPTDHTVAAGVLETIEARTGIELADLNAWAAEIGPEQFELLLADSSGDANEFFYALAEAGDEGISEDEMEELGGQDSYDRYVGPAVSRIEDAYLAARSVSA